MSHSTSAAMQAPPVPFAPVAFDPGIGVLLRRLLMQHGHGLTGDHDRLQALLAQHCPHAHREIELLLLAQRSGLPQHLHALFTASGSTPVAFDAQMAALMATQLATQWGLPGADAQWAVHTWAQALGAAPLPLQPPAPHPVVVSGPRHQGELAAAPPGHRTARAALRWPVVGALGAAVALAAAGAWYAWVYSSLDILNAAPRTTLLADGKPRDVVIDYTSRNTRVDRVDVRFVRGDGPWSPTSWSVEPPSTSKDTGSIAVGPFARSSAAPVNATFEFTLVGENGKRSAPLERSFQFAPVVAITQAQAPERVKPGQPISVNLSYRKGAGDIVKVQRRVVASTLPWPDPEQTSTVMLNPATGTYEVKFDAPAKPTRSTLEFVMSDSLGGTSEPVRVQLEVAESPRAVAAHAEPSAAAGSPATVLSVVQVSGSSATPGAGAALGIIGGAALGNRMGRGNGRAAMTVAGAALGGYAGHQIQQQYAGSPMWETTLRYDNGSVSRIRLSTSPTWSAGQRVRVVNGRIVN